MTNYSGKTFIVTGGASGLGEATVRRFSALGGNVAILDRDQDRGQNVAKDCGNNVKFFNVDATNEEAIKTAVDDAASAFGGIHGVVNCAGLGNPMLTLSKRGPHDSSVFDFLQKVNVYGTFNTCKYAAVHMAKNDPDEAGLRGVIINCASVAGLEGQKGQVAYAASKGAVIAMTLPMARDLGSYGIRVCTIAPGSFRTPLMLHASDKVIASLTQSIVAPKRMGMPEEFAHMCSTIVDNKYLNGETIRLDGGIRMGYMSKI